MTETERKSPAEIKQKILEALNEKPLNALEISKQIGSNWSTVKTYVEELTKEGKVSEISLGENNFYQKITGDTYFNIPIKEDQRQMFKFIFSKIIQEYKERANRLPKKTELAKASVEVIERANIKDLPLVWYLYGQIPLMIVNPSADYSTNYVPKEKEKLNKIIIEIVSHNTPLRISELKSEQYNKHNQMVYIEKNTLIKELSLEKNDKKILNSLKNFYLKIDLEKNKESFVYFDKIYFLAREFSKRETLEKERAKLMLALESCWKLMALENLIESLAHLQQYNRKEIVEFYLSSALMMQRNMIQECLEELNEIYTEGLKEPELNKETLEARRIMEGWTGE